MTSTKQIHQNGVRKLKYAKVQPNYTLWYAVPTATAYTTVYSLCDNKCDYIDF